MQRIFLLFGIFIGLYTATAQESVYYSVPENHIRRGQELFDKGVYSAAIKEFELYIEKGTDEILKVDCEYYKAASLLKLNMENSGRFLVNFVQNHPDSRKVNEAYYALANYYFDKGKFSRSMRYYKKVDILTVPPAERDDFRFKKGYAYFMRKKYKEAKDLLKPLTNQRNSNYYTRANYYYGYACYNQGLFDQAIKAFDRVGNDGPQNMDFIRAQIYYQNGKYNKSLEQLSKINLDKLKTEAEFLKGKNYFRLKDYRRALYSFEIVKIPISKLSKEEIYEMGASYHYNKQYEKAILWLNKVNASEIMLRQSTAYMLGTAYLKLGKKKNAHMAFYEAQRGDKVDGIREEAMFNFAKISAELGTPNAVTTMENFTKQYPNSKHNDEARAVMAKLMMGSEDYKKAVTLLESVPNKSQTDLALYQKITFRWGQKLFQASDWIGAEKAFNKSLRYNKDRKLEAEANFWLGEIAYRKGLKRKALRYYSKFTDNPNSTKSKMYATAYYNSGYVYFDQKKYGIAERYFSKFKKHALTHAYEKNIYNDAMLRIGDCNFMVRKYPEAINSYAYISSRNLSGSDYALFQRGIIYGLQGKSGQKIATLKRIGNLYPKSVYVPKAIYEIATEQVIENNTHNAIRNFKYILDDYPTHAYAKKCMLSLGQIYYNQEKDNEALRYFKNVVEKYKGSEEASAAYEYVEKIYTERGDASGFLRWVKTLPNNSIRPGYSDSITYSAALSLVKKGQYASAVTKFKQYLSKYPRGFFVIESHYYKSYSLEQLNQGDQAIDDYKALVHSNNQDYQEDAALKLGRYYYKKEDYTNAAVYYRDLETFSTSSDNQQEAVSGQMSSYFYTNKFQKAETKANQLLQFSELTDYNKGESRMILGKVGLRNNNHGQALKYFKEVYTMFNTEVGAEAKYFEAKTYFDLDKYEEAKASIYKFSDDFAYYRYWLGKSFLLLGDVFYAENDEFQAKATWNNVLENYKNAEIKAEAQKRLSMLAKKNAPAPENEEDEDY